MYGTKLNPYLVNGDLSGVNTHDSFTDIVVPPASDHMHDPAKKGEHLFVLDSSLGIKARARIIEARNSDGMTVARVDASSMTSSDGGTRPHGKGVSPHAAMVGAFEDRTRYARARLSALGSLLSCLTIVGFALDPVRSVISIVVTAAGLGRVIAGEDFSSGGLLPGFDSTSASGGGGGGFWESVGNAVYAPVSILWMFLFPVVATVFVRRYWLVAGGTRVSRLGVFLTTFAGAFVGVLMVAFLVITLLASEVLTVQHLGFLYDDTNWQSAYRTTSIVSAGMLLASAATFARLCAPNLKTRRKR